MDPETRRRVVVCILLCTDIMVRMLLANTSRPCPTLPRQIVPRRKRTRNDEDDDDDDDDELLAAVPLLFGKRKRRFWCALRSPGVWNDDVIVHWNTMGVQWDVADWEDDQYRLHLRLSKSAFWTLHGVVGGWLERSVTHYRLPVSSAKRLSITLHWIAHGLSMAQLALIYGIGKSTAVAIVHDTISVLKKQLANRVIKFPSGKKLRTVMKEFKELCGLPRCAGAIDGTFMRIRKPVKYVDAYYCYQKYSSILILAVVDASGQFTYIDAGRAGSMGDAATFHASGLEQKINDKTWLTILEREENRNVLNGTYMRPYLVGDAAFPLAPTMMKCFSDNQALEPYQRTFNYRLIRTRRVVEQAFGRLKGRFAILDSSKLRDPIFAADVALVCCALHNFCETFASTEGESWCCDPQEYGPGPNDRFVLETNATGSVVREKLARHVHTRRPI